MKPWEMEERTEKARNKEFEKLDGEVIVDERDF